MKNLRPFILKGSLDAVKKKFSATCGWRQGQALCHRKLVMNSELKGLISGATMVLTD